MSKKLFHSQHSAIEPDPPQINLSALTAHAIKLHQQGHFKQAAGLYRHILTLEPNNFNALHLLGVIAAQSGNPLDAVELISKAIAVNSNKAQAFNNRGNAYKELDRVQEALADYDRAIDIKPDYLDALNNRGLIFHKQRKYYQALADYAQALAYNPQQAVSFVNRGYTFIALEHYLSAIDSFSQAINIEPDNAEIYVCRGNVFYQIGNLHSSLSNYDKAIELIPDYLDAHTNRGNVLTELNRHDEALECRDKVIELGSPTAESYSHRALTYRHLKQYDAALADCNQALALDPNSVGALNNLGLIQVDLKRFKDAQYNYDKAIEIDPEFAASYANRGNLFIIQQHYQLAIENFNHYLTLKSNDINIYNNCAHAHFMLRQYQEALAVLTQAIEINPNVARVYVNRGLIYGSTYQTTSALADYNRAFELDPDLKGLLFGMRLHTKMLLCDWEDFDALSQKLLERIYHREYVTAPFPALALFDDPAAHKIAAEIYVNEVYPHRDRCPVYTSDNNISKIRLGYFSADFHEHPVARLMVGVFEAHDRNRFEIFAFSLGSNSQSALRKRLISAFDHFIDCNAMTDMEIAFLAREHQIHIAIDLGGYTKNSKPGIFGHRAAPIQASYIGYLGTLGSDLMDYLIADSIIITDDNREHYSEKIVSLPWYQANDNLRTMSDKLFSRAELNLPENGFVFCCFNKNYKIVPAVFEAWMRILHRVPDSVLLIYTSSQDTKSKLIEQSTLRGLHPDRLVFADRMPIEDYLARFKSCGLFLDTFPYNAGTTASDALWAGLPVLTLSGLSFASRMAASLLTALGLPELITNNMKAYEDKAVDLATYPDKLLTIRNKLDNLRDRTSLFDNKQFTLNLEKGFEAMYEKWRHNMPPDHIFIESSPTETGLGDSLLLN
jgi:predicted O-linked N-acetylglucosamine transferase (SPINDLY family)